MAWTKLCQEATDWRGDLPECGSMYEEKIDGWRSSYFTGIDGQPRLWTREGLPINGADHIHYRLGLMEKMAGEAMFFDGEWQVDGSLAATKEWAERGWKLGGEKGVFYAFDCLTMAEWREGGSDTPLYRRKARLAELWQAVEDDPALSWEWRPGSRGRDDGAAAVVILPDDWAADQAHVMAQARRVWARGGEGLMLKDAEAPYRRDRNAHWRKVKQGGPYWRNVA